MYRLRINISHVTAIAMAAVSGVLLLFAHAPFNVWPLSFFVPAALTAAIWRNQHDSARRLLPAALLGAVAGLSFFGPLLSWLFLPAGLTGWGLLVLTQTGYMAILAVLIRACQNMRFAAVAIGMAWTALDVVRGVFPLSGFQWGAIAYTHVDGSWLLPVARIAGANGITFLVVTLSVAGLQLVAETASVARNRNRQGLGTTLSLGHVPTATLLTALFLSVLLTVEPPPETGTRNVLAVQGNNVKHWLPDRPGGDAPLRIANAHADLTVASVNTQGPPDLTLWPESSLDRDPFSARGQNLFSAIERATAAAGVLLAGSTLDGPDPTTQRYVAAVMFDESANQVGQYTKRRLVPFGEYLPMRRYLDWFGPLAQVPRDALPGGASQQILLADGTPIAVVICFETMFSPIVRSNITAGPVDAQLLVVLTNNASFGVSGAPFQHLAQSQMRAVESGRWVVHAAISGASAIIDPYGRIHQQTDLFTLDTLRDDIPLVAGRTPFLMTGDLVGSTAVAFTLLLIGIRLFKRTRRAASH